MSSTDHLFPVLIWTPVFLSVSPAALNHCVHLAGGNCILQKEKKKNPIDACFYLLNHNGFQHIIVGNVQLVDTEKT